ncbi:MAG: hypoxanthine phosphoribosyltransferase [Syntrophobacteraceae bacterium]
MNEDIIEILFTQEMIHQRVAEIGKEIAAAYTDSFPILIGVLKGCSIFLADLVRHIEIPLEMDYMASTSYGGMDQHSGAVRITKDLDTIIEGRDVLLVEGLIDTGMTAGYLLRNLEARGPRSIRVCAFLDKRVRRIVNIPVAFVGFQAPDRFAVGYGLDFRQLYRNLPYIGILSDEATGLNRRRESPARIAHGPEEKKPGH